MSSDRKQSTMACMGRALGNRRRGMAWLVSLASLALIIGIVALRNSRSETSSATGGIHLGAHRPIEPHSKPNLTSVDWPQWRGPKRDGISRERGWRRDRGSSGPPILWQRHTSGPGYSGLAVVRNRLYTMMQDGPTEAVVCWDAETGRELWRRRYAARFVSDQGSGPRATPTVDDNRVYTLGATGILHCLDERTGAVQWRRDLVADFGGHIPEWGVAASPLIDGDWLYVTPGGAQDTSVVCLEKKSGKVRWTSLNDRPAYSSPVIATAAGVRQLILLTGEGLVSLSLEEGRLYWRLPWSTSMDCNVATPICHGDEIFISSGYGKGCALLRVVARGAGALDVETMYAHRRMRNHFSTSVLYEGHLYGFDETRLVCMEWATGKLRWEARGFRKGSVLISDGHLIILGENGKLALAEATPEAYRELCSVRVTRGRCWTVPTLAGGKLFIRDPRRIVCYDLRHPSGRAAKSARANERKHLSTKSVVRESHRS